MVQKQKRPREPIEEVHPREIDPIEARWERLKGLLLDIKDDEYDGPVARTTRKAMDRFLDRHPEYRGKTPKFFTSRR